MKKSKRVKKLLEIEAKAIKLVAKVQKTGVKWGKVNDTIVGTAAYSQLARDPRYTFDDVVERGKVEFEDAKRAQAEVAAAE